MSSQGLTFRICSVPPAALFPLLFAATTTTTSPLPLGSILQEVLPPRRCRAIVRPGVHLLAKHRPKELPITESKFRGHLETPNIFARIFHYACWYQYAHTPTFSILDSTGSFKLRAGAEKPPLQTNIFLSRNLNGFCLMLPLALLLSSRSLALVSMILVSGERSPVWPSLSPCFGV
jgi:hypothetical protein